MASASDIFSFFFKKSKSEKNVFFLRLASVSEFVVQRIQILKKIIYIYICIYIYRGRGGGELEKVIFFTKNPSLKIKKKKKILFFEGMGGRGAIVCEFFFTKNPNLKLKKNSGGLGWGG